MVLWTGQVVSVLGSQITLLAFPLLVLALTGSPAQAGVVAFFNTIPVLLLNLPGGALIDRHDRRKVMIACNLIGATALGSLALAIALDELHLWHIIVVAFLQGAVTVVFSLAEQGALPRVVPSEQVADAVAQNESRSYAAQLAGPPLGGVLFGVGRLAPFLLDAVSYLVGALSLCLIRTPLQEPRTHARRRLTTEIAEGVRWLWQQRFLRTSALLVAAGNFVWAGLLLVLIVEAKRQGASSATVGVMLALLAAGGLVGSFAAPSLRRRLSARTIVVGGFWIEAALIPLLALRPDPYLLGSISALAAMTAPAWNAVVVGARLTLTPDRLLGRVNSAARLISGSMIPLGSLLGGVAAEALGTRTTFIAFAAVALLVAAAGTSARSLRRGLDSPPSVAAA